ncbi:MAG TPA: DUF4367 domain-containing protein [Candidatus Choladousia intestinavium]|uniref:DUF4367 domain-containing protein n=1 Tax=Candidatus Choladousia intestinavium TaxID=2840727 RepID=A0A9D1D8N6_9FIRM|nr:DUF4367 domain-containing protein [Candidatus Choladousia intestinavium]
MKETTKDKPGKGDKISPIRIDQEVLDDPRMDEFIRESLKKEADELEAELNSDPSLEGIKAPDDMFEKLVAKLKEEGVWEEEAEEPEEKESRQTVQQDSQENGDSKEVSKENVSDEGTLEQDLEKLYSMLPKEDQEALKLGRAVSEKKKRRSVKRKKRLKILKRAGVAAAMLVLVFGISMTSDANRKLVMQVWDGVAERFGVKLEVDYIDDGIVESQRKEEEEAFEEIKQKTGIREIDFLYLPESMKFESYVIDDKTNEIRIYYLYKETIFYILIYQAENQRSSYQYLDGNFVFKETYTNDQNIEMEIWEAKQENNSMAYAASFHHDDYSYVCNGEIEYSEFMKILKFFVVD